LTRDHSQIWELIEAGILDPATAEKHAAANVITRAVGAQPELVLDKVVDRLVPNDLFILCTDGLSEMVPQPVLAEIACATPLPQIPDALISAALAHGGRDNVTVVAVRVGDPVERGTAGC